MILAFGPREWRFPFEPEQVRMPGALFEAVPCAGRCI
jgi:hypothetical protein